MTGSAPPSPPLSNPASDDDLWSYSDPSDIPRLEASHTKAGYRDGVEAGRNLASLVQRGFDEGYPLGAALGLAVGRILGVLGEFARAGGEEERERLRCAERDLELSRLLEGLEGELGRAQGGEEEWVVGEGWMTRLEVVTRWSGIVEGLVGSGGAVLGSRV